MNLPLSASHRRIVRILEILREAEEALCPAEIAKAMCITYRSLYNGNNYLRWMEENGMIHVAAWKRQEDHGGPYIPYYLPGIRLRGKLRRPKAKPSHEKVSQRRKHARELKALSGPSVLSLAFGQLMKSAGITGE